jgi:hypothetical protein
VCVCVCCPLLCFVHIFNSLVLEELNAMGYEEWLVSDAMEATQSSSLTDCVTWINDQLEKLAASNVSVCVCVCVCVVVLVVFKEYLCVVLGRKQDEQQQQQK